MWNEYLSMEELNQTYLSDIVVYLSANKLIDLQIKWWIIKFF